MPCGEASLGERRSDAVDPPEHFATASSLGRAPLEETEVGHEDSDEGSDGDSDGDSSDGDDAQLDDARLDGEIDLRPNRHATGGGST